jgi:hypothetical protein
VMSRLLRRTVRRALTREELWGTGNTESLVRSFFSRRSILWWAVKTHRRNRARFTVECGALPKNKKVVRLKSPREVARFVTLSSGSRTGRGSTAGPAGR